MTIGLPSLQGEAEDNSEISSVFISMSGCNSQMQLMTSQHSPWRTKVPHTRLSLKLMRSLSL